MLSKQSRHPAYMLTMRYSRGEHEAHTTQGKGVSHPGMVHGASSAPATDPLSDIGLMGGAAREFSPTTAEQKGDWEEAMGFTYVEVSMVWLYAYHLSGVLNTAEKDTN
ncbi:hypothetical protein [Ktedonospora formicarum]|uniref:Uncharacterized protein n=1 Tax=Ktedonospora formicarum TaxID=2778364 RepID=A0A8J3IA14_9CHLR|nr:hypothetical protein [Ktedonospora formicarum]GHO48483.1 hypothetical protein KSX_66460 [Ktedonospora formicarum]